MKLSLKNFNELREQKRELYNEKEYLKRENRPSMSMDVYKQIQDMESKIKEIEKIIETSSNVIEAHYNIGYRDYIGKILKFGAKSFRTFEGIQLKDYQITLKTDMSESFIQTIEDLQRDNTYYY